MSDETDLWWNIGIQLCHHYTDTSLIRQVSECLSLYSEFQKAVFDGGQKKIPLLVRTFRSYLSTGLEKIFENAPHIPPEEIFQIHPYLTSFLTCFSGSFVSQLKLMVIYPSSDSW